MAAYQIHSYPHQLGVVMYHLANLPLGNKSPRWCTRKDKTLEAVVLQACIFCVCRSGGVRMSLLWVLHGTILSSVIFILYFHEKHIRKYIVFGVSWGFRTDYLHSHSFLWWKIIWDTLGSRNTLNLYVNVELRNPIPHPNPNWSQNCSIQQRNKPFPLLVTLFKKTFRKV